MNFSFKSRQQTINQLEKDEEIFDLLIIGGGITGAGTARDAASRGMKVLLVEANDFAFGTSSRSSKLIHGGLRYLENLEFGLVYEALNERELLYKLAPHLVHPLRFLLPIYKHGRVGFFKMGCAMWLYDTLCFFKAKMHEKLNVKKSLERIPSLQTKGLQGSYVYSDAYMDDDRLTIETLRSAVKQESICLNYVKVTGGEFSGEVKKIKLQDQRSCTELNIRTRHCICTVGPWTDVLGKELTPDWTNILQPSKGIHLTLPHERLPLQQAVVMADDKNQRIVFGIPRHDMVIVGTTDNAYSGKPEDVAATGEDVDYLLGILEEYFPKAKLKKEDIMASYAGVRPLVKELDKGGNVGKTSREHTILSHPIGITFVAGGKYTTYRKMAKEIVDRSLESFSQADKESFGKSKTKRPLNDLCSKEELERSYLMVEKWSQDYGIDRDWIEKLTFRHGMESEQILKSYNLQESGFVDKTSEEKYWFLEARHAIDQSMCGNLVDFYWRRVPLFLGQKGHGENLLNFFADIFQEQLNWDDNEKELQKESVKKQMDFELSWR